MKKVLIIGSPGSGKSTFSRALAERTGLPLYHLDMIYHKSDKTTITTEQFDRALEEILGHDTWIIDGNYGRTLSWRLSHCDTVFFFDLPTAVCLAGVERRIGKPRPDMPWQETEFDPEFRAYIETFRETRTPTLYARLSEHPTLSLTVFHTHSEVEEYLSGLS